MGTCPAASGFRCTIRPFPKRRFRLPFRRGCGGSGAEGGVRRPGGGDSGRRRPISLRFRRGRGPRLPRSRKVRPRHARYGNARRMSPRSGGNPGKVQGRTRRTAVRSITRHVIDAVQGRPPRAADLVFSCKEQSWPCCRTRRATALARGRPLPPRPVLKAQRRRRFPLSVGRNPGAALSGGLKNTRFPKPGVVP